MKKTFRSAFLVLLAILGTASAFSSDEKESAVGESALERGGDFKAAFAQLKRLEGTWDEADDGRVVEYHLTGRGSALIEEFMQDDEDKRQDRVRITTEICELLDSHLIDEADRPSLECRNYLNPR